MAKTQFIDNNKLIKYGEETDNLNNQYSSFCDLSSYFVAVCGQIPAETIESEFHAWIEKLSSLSGIWIEGLNGIESRQALILFNKEDGLSNAMTDVREGLFKSTVITIEKITDGLKDITGKRFLLNQIQNEQEVKKLIRNMLQDDIIQRIDSIIADLNISRNETKENTGIYPTISDCDLLLIKFCCDILHKILKLFSLAEKKGIHPFYTEMKRMNIIQLIYQKCLICGESEVIKEDGAYTLGQFLREQNIEPEMKKIIIQQLKKGINENNISNRKVEILDVLCRLAVKDDNIDDIISGNFILSVSQLIKSTEQDLWKNALELLLIISEKGSTVELEVRNAIGDFGFLRFLQLIYSECKMRAITQTMKWNKNEQLKTIKQFAQMSLDYRNTNLIY
ncbi:MAG: hypothetical protein EZS28_017679 [Streblomastix strix]|uniref:Uncharacterized protein n=1 Tax=Streblomastix strix TaxID=222440 RepID=A0A5J4VVR0_9EUKA|nr:MAG: hypothetical protein EZS28_017679 [Streblomastix strix]